MNILSMIFPRKKGHDDDFSAQVYGDQQFAKRESGIYKAYAQVAFDFFRPLNFIDVGCANAFIPEFMRLRGVDSYGIEGADAAFRYMPEGIKDRVYKLDLRQDWNEFFFRQIRLKFEVVNFTEVAEHLKPEHEDVMLTNVKMLCDKILIMSWSNEWCPYRGTEQQEHFNPRSKRYVKRRLEGLGFDYCAGISKDFNTALDRLDVYAHWKGNIMIFRL